MSSPLNVLWKKEEQSNLGYIDIFAVVGHEVNLAEHDKAVEQSGPNGKNNVNAAEHQAKGKQLFEDGDYIAAIRELNNSLALYTADSPELGSVYAERSKCFLQLDLPQKALIDIELAKKSSYTHELTAREDKCKYLLEDEEFKAKQFTGHEPTLSFNEHETFAGVAGCLEFRKSDDFGYHVVTTRDLKIGQTVLVEPSFAITPALSSASRYSRCGGCYKELENFVPSKISSFCVYCNGNCIKNSLHEEMSMSTLKETTELVEPILQKIVSAFPDIDVLVKTVESLQKGEDVTDLTSTVQKQACSLFRLINKHEISTDQQFKLRPAADTFVTVMKKPHFGRIFNTEERQRFLKHLILHLHNVTEYAIDLYELQQEDIDEPIRGHTFVHYATAIYPFGGYIKHSCVPNVIWFSVDDRLIAKVIRPIEKGEQILRSYHPGTHSFQLDNDLEEKHVEIRYKFKCNCCRCLDDEPSSPPTKLHVDQDPLWVEVAAVIDMTVKDFWALSSQAIEQYEKKAIELVAKYNSVYPNHDVLFMRDNLMLIWILLAQTQKSR
ncbi:N-lysine methyltransferase SMYD2-B-like [Sitodiplosis mosellana]|uniref:N-lysine methyltransferase SMYD2-B-like n=1 Tax=Sitodiplosis mosellana TaxID=263140 RepID=UPI002444534B|nr:N-lysine methyltransferase SMYD2-B-like [Sitodiplosis mosellana]